MPQSQDGDCITPRRMLHLPQTPIVCPSLPFHHAFSSGMLIALAPHVKTVRSMTIFSARVQPDHWLVAPWCLKLFPNVS